MPKNVKNTRSFSLPLTLRLIQKQSSIRYFREELFRPFFTVFLSHGIWIVRARSWKNVETSRVDADLVEGVDVRRHSVHVETVRSVVDEDWKP